MTQYLVGDAWNGGLSIGHIRVFGDLDAAVAYAAALHQEKGYRVATWVRIWEVSDAKEPKKIKWDWRPASADTD